MHGTMNIKYVVSCLELLPRMDTEKIGINGIAGSYFINKK